MTEPKNSSMTLIDCVFTKMEALWSDGPEAVMLCRCGTRFNVDACTEENLRLATDGSKHRELVAVCPNCHSWDLRDWMVPPEARTG